MAMLATCVTPVVAYNDKDIPGGRQLSRPLAPSLGFHFLLQAATRSASNALHCSLDFEMPRRLALWIIVRRAD
jgi:hypothetical protein